MAGELGSRPSRGKEHPTFMEQGSRHFRRSSGICGETEAQWPLATPVVFSLFPNTRGGEVTISAGSQWKPGSSHAGCLVSGWHLSSELWKSSEWHSRSHLNPLRNKSVTSYFALLYMKTLRNKFRIQRERTDSQRIRFLEEISIGTWLDEKNMFCETKTSK